VDQDVGYLAIRVCVEMNTSELRVLMRPATAIMFSNRIVIPSEAKDPRGAGRFPVRAEDRRELGRVPVFADPSLRSRAVRRAREPSRVAARQAAPVMRARGLLLSPRHEMPGHVGRAGKARPLALMVPASGLHATPPGAPTIQARCTRHDAYVVGGRSARGARSRGVRPTRPSSRPATRRRRWLPR
jgi:hypothetical protein